MSETAIAWTDAVWNPVRGCSRVSEGCRNCYAERIAARFSDVGKPFHDFATRNPARWTGRVALIPEKLDEPLRWRKPRRVFVNSMSDLFHESLSDWAIESVFGIMALARHHAFQVLTKRPGRMRDWCLKQNGDFGIVWPGFRLTPNGTPSGGDFVGGNPWPLPNVWLGVSVEDQKAADERIPLLLRTPAALRFVSYEPALETVDFRDGLGRISEAEEPNCHAPGVDWVIVGGESGPHARPCEIDWIRSAVERCKAAGVPAFIKQDSGPRPGMQGRIPDDLWTLKQFPEPRP